jgi:hypothetical protein
MTTRVRPNRIITVNEAGLMADMFWWVLRRALPEDQALRNRILDEWHIVMAENPHEHYQGMLGPYCAACHANIPESEWSKTLTPQ